MQNWGLRDACRRIAVLLSLVGSLAGGPVLAGAFQVSPVHIHVPHARPVAAVTLKNEAAEAVSVRAVAYRWAQVDGEDVLTPSQDILITPPIFTVDPSATQLVRVGLQVDAGEAEANYRVVFEEIPSSTEQTEGLKVTLRLSLPFHKKPKVDGRPDVSWKARVDPVLGLIITAANSGTLHQRVLGVSSILPDGTSRPLISSGTVVLPGGERQWVLGEIPELSAKQSSTLLVLGSNGEERVPLAWARD